MSRTQAGVYEILTTLSTSKLDQSVKEVKKKLKKFGRDTERMGKTLTRSFTAPLGAISALSIKLSNDLNKELARVGTLVPNNAALLESYKDSVTSLSIEFGQSAESMTQGLFDVISALGESKDNVEQLEIAASAAIGGGSTTQEAIGLLSSVTKAYGVTTADALQHVADLAFQTNKLGVTTFPELAANMGKVAPVAAALGVSQEELFGVMAEGTGTLGNTAEVATQLRGIMAAMMKPTADMTEAFKANGVATGQALIEKLGFVEALQSIRRHADESGTQLIKYYGRIEATTAALALSGNQAESYAEKTKKMGDVSGIASEAMRQMTDGVNVFGFELQRLQQMGLAALREFGDLVSGAIGVDGLKFFQDMIQGVRDGISAFKELDPQIQTFTLSFAGIGAVLGPLLVSLGAVASFVGGVLLAKFVLVSAAVAAAGAAYIAWGDDIREAISGAIETLSNYYEAAKETFSGGLIEEWINLIRKAMEFLEEKTVGAAKRAYDSIVAIGKAFTELKKIAVREISAVLDSIPDLSSLMNVLPGGPIMSQALKAGSGIISDFKQNLAEVETNQKAAAESAELHADLLAELESSLEGVAKAGDEAGNALGGGGGGSGGGSGGGLSGKGKKASDVVKKLTEELEELRRETSRLELEEKLNNALANGDFSGANVFRDKLEEKTREGVRAGYESALKDAQKAGSAAYAAAKERVQEIEDIRAKETVKQIEGQISDAQKRSAEKSAEFWRSAFQNQINGTTFDLKDSLERLGVGFGAKMAESFFGEMEGGIGSLEDMGSTIAKKLLGVLDGGIGGLFGEGGLSSLISSLSAGVSAIGPAGAAAIAAPFIQGTFERIASGHGSLDQTGNIYANANPFIPGELADPILGFFSSAFGSGKSGDQRKRDSARRALQDAGLIGDNWMMDLATGGTADLGREEFGGINLSEKYGDGKLGGFGGALTSGIASLFSGGDSGLKEDLEIMFGNAVSGFAETADAVGSFNEVLLNAQGILDKIGMSAEDGKNALLDMFLDGKVGLAEFGQGVAGFNVLAQDNLLGEGSVLDAVKILGDNLGKDGPPGTSLKALELMFKEASELGEDQLGILIDFVTQNFGPEVGSMFEEIGAMGITSFEDFADLSADEVFALFDIISGFSDSVIDEFSRAGEEGASRFSAGLEDINRQVQEAEENIRSLGDIDVSLGGADNGPKVSQGNATARTNINISVDASGSESGVELKVRRELEAVAPLLIDAAVNKTQDRLRRGYI